MFPFVIITPSGLNPTVLYSVTLQIVSADNFRYKYTDSQWHSVCTTDVIHDETRMKYRHPFTPAPGEQLNNRPLDFKTMKLTHYLKSKNGDVSIIVQLLLIHLVMCVTIRFYCTQCTSILLKCILMKCIVKKVACPKRMRKQSTSLDFKRQVLLQ